MKYLKVLYVQVIIGIIFGVLTGYFFPGFRDNAKLISEMFINLIRMMIAPIIFFTVVLGITGAGELKRIGRVGAKALIYFEILSTIALIIGLLVANFYQPGAGVDPSQVPRADISKITADAAKLDWRQFVLHIIPSNIVEAFASGDIIPIVFFAVLFSFGLRLLGTSGAGLLNSFELLNRALFHVLGMVIRLSPIGAFGGMAYTVASFGFISLIVLGKLLLSFYLTSLLFIFIVLHLVLRWYGFSLWKLLGYVKAEILIVFGASSSEAVLPNLMQKLEEAGCDRGLVGLIIPTGYSFNLDGTTIYLSMAFIFLSQVYHVPLSLGQQIMIIGILMITSKGAAAVTGGGFLMLTSTLTAMKVVPLEGLGLLIGVDRFMSEARAITNMIGNTVATVVISKSEKAVDMKKYKEVVERKLRGATL
ncbi:MAG: C4-dicarboxylate transporter DctA [Flavisolibacter sp.]